MESWPSMGVLLESVRLFGPPFVSSSAMKAPMVYRLCRRILATPEDEGEITEDVESDEKDEAGKDVDQEQQSDLEWEGSSASTGFSDFEDEDRGGLFPAPAVAEVRIPLKFPGPCPPR